MFACRETLVFGQSDSEGVKTEAEAQRPARPVVLALATTENDEGFHENSEIGPAREIGTDTNVAGTVGYRFVDTDEAKLHTASIKPLAVAMKATQLPPLHMMRGMSVGWLHTLRLHDFFQHTYSFATHWTQCMCSMARMKECDGVGKRFNRVRSVLLIDSQVLKSPSLTMSPRALKLQALQRSSSNASSENMLSLRSRLMSDFQQIAESEDSESYSEDGISVLSRDFVLTLPDSPEHLHEFRVDTDQAFMYMAVVKDQASDSFHLFVKARPERLIPYIKHAYMGGGDKLEKMTPELQVKLQNVLVQWRSEAFESFAFGFVPLTRAQAHYLLHSFDDHTILTTTPHRPAPFSLEKSGAMTTRSAARRRTIQESSYRRNNTRSIHEHSIKRSSPPLSKRNSPPACPDDNVWRPLVTSPGPRSIPNRSEPFVMPRSLLASAHVKKLRGNSIDAKTFFVDYDNCIYYITHEASLQPTYETPRSTHNKSRSTHDKSRSLQHTPHNSHETPRSAGEIVPSTHETSYSRRETQSAAHPETLELTQEISSSPDPLRSTSESPKPKGDAVASVNKVSSRETAGRAIDQDCQSRLQFIDTDESDRAKTRPAEVALMDRDEAFSLFRKVSVLPLRTSRMGAELLQKLFMKNLILTGLAATRLRVSLERYTCRTCT